jgi:molybdopterin-guanine dinucleotide biosynthesis protein A
MGRDKARLRLGGDTMLGHVRAAAQETGLPVRTIRRDLVRRCGPIGGIYTALATTQADAILFLACDMPSITAQLIQFLLGKLRLRQQAAFLANGHDRGFPFVLRRGAAEVVAKQIENGKFSLRELAKVLKARVIQVPTAYESQLKNINTPEEWRRFKRGMGHAVRASSRGLLHQ